MISWMIILSVASAALAAIQYLLIRQIGWILYRLAPIGARLSLDDAGPRIGENITAHLDSDHRHSYSCLYLFLSHSCAICREVKVAALELAKHWHRHTEIILVYDETANTSDNRGAGTNRPGVQIQESSTLRRRLSIDSVPYGVRVDSTGTVIGKGLVNEISHVESLLELEAPKDDGRQWTGEYREPLLTNSKN